MPADMTVYHYTDVNGKDGILRDKRIVMASGTGSFPAGVYVTKKSYEDKNMKQSDICKQMYNSAANFNQHKCKTLFVIRMLLPKTILVDSKEDNYYCKEDIDLSTVPYGIYGLNWESDGTYTSHICIDSSSRATTPRSRGSSTSNSARSRSSLGDSPSTRPSTPAADSIRESDFPPLQARSRPPLQERSRPRWK